LFNLVPHSSFGGRLKDADATATLILATDGSREEAERLFQLVYRELRSMAKRELSRERADHSLQPTELVHEVFFRLVDRTRLRFEDQKHFLSLACRAMRQILVDHARRRSRDKRGGGWERVAIDGIQLQGARDDDTTLLELNRSLERFMARHPDKARIVEMHFFVGFKLEECAEILGISLRTVSRGWAFAQAWLARDMMDT
jgi:RNA polymerase sigma-70 factor, ECF subfamily